MKMKTIGLGILTLFLGVLLFGYPIILSTFFVTESGTKLGGLWFIILSIVTLYAFIRLILWVIQRVVRKTRRREEIRSKIPLSTCPECGEELDLTLPCPIVCPYCGLKIKRVQALKKKGGERR